MRRTRGCAAAVKGDMVVEVSDGQGQVARACEDRGSKAKALVPVDSLRLRPCHLLCGTCNHFLMSF